MRALTPPVIENITGGSADDRIAGNSDSNKIQVVETETNFIGGGGNDNLDGGNGNDLLNAGAGDGVLTVVPVLIPLISPASSC